MWTQDVAHAHLTAMAAVWGQLVAHDISYTLPLSGYDQCCDAMFRKQHAMECFPISDHNAGEEGGPCQVSTTYSS